MNNRSDMLGKENIRILLMKLSIPAIIGMGVNALYNLVDTIFVAQGAGEIAIGALGYASAVQMIVYALGLMIGIGGASVFSRAYGRNDKETMKHTINTSLRVGVILALFVSTFGYLFLDEILRFFRATDSNISYAKDYLNVILIGLVPLTLSMVLNNFARAEGRANLSMFGFIIGAGLNIILDPIFIFDWGLGLGVQGAALATVISQFISFGFLLYFSLKKESVLEIDLINPFHIDFNVLKDILVIGFPTFLRNSLGSILSMIIFILIDENVAGDPAIYVSIYSVISRLLAFLFLPSFGVVQGMAPIIGFNFGAKKFDRIRDTLINGVLFIVTYFAVVFLFVQLFSEKIFMIFSDSDSGFFIEYGSNAFRTMSYGYIILGFQIIMSSVYQAMGYPKRALLVGLSRQFIFFIPLVYLLTYLFGLEGLWYTYSAADILAGLVGIVFFIFELRYLKRMQAPELLTQ